MKKHICPLLLIAFCFVSNATAQNGWTTAAPMTSPRYGMATGVIDGKIYVVGGHDTAYLNTLEVYDPAMNTWKTLAPMPAVRYQAFAGVIGGKLYVAGGTDGSIVAATLFVYDPLTNIWSTLAPMPTARYVAAGGVINGKVYVAGGFVPGAITSTNKLEVYDPATNTWETKTPMPNGGRYGAGGAVFTNKLYVAGGSGFSLGRTRILEVYDPLTDSWTAKASMPQIQFNISAGAGVLDGRLYTIGGETMDSPIANIVQVYDPPTDNWSTAPVLPTARTALSAGVVGNSIYVVGGYNGTTAVATHEVFTPLAPTAANVSVSGRVLTADGRGIAKVRVTLIDLGGNVRSVLSNPFGYYAFDEVQAGETYVLTVRGKRYTFANPSQVVTAFDSVTGVDFTASP